MPAKRRPRSTDASLDGLDAVIAEPETTELMRAVAQRAKARNETFGTLAKRYNALRGTNLAHANIATALRAQRPRPASIETFACILGMSVTDLHVLAGALLPLEETEDELKRVRFELADRLGRYESAAIAEALHYIEDGDTATKQLIATQSRRFNLQLPFGSDLLAVAFEGVLDLQLHRRTASLNETALFDLWLGAFGSFELTEAEAIVALGIGLLRRRGIDTTAMELRLYHECAAWNERLASSITAREKT